VNFGGVSPFLVYTLRLHIAMASEYGRNSDGSLDGVPLYSAFTHLHIFSRRIALVLFRTATNDSPLPRGFL
jgi:hypothetical protein